MTITNILGNEQKQTPLPKSVRQLNKLSRWTVWIMDKSGRFNGCSERIKKEVEMIVESCRDSL